MDKGPVKKVVGLSVELQHYEDSEWWSSDKELLQKHGPLLFFKENEKVILHKFYTFSYQSFNL